MISEQNQCAEQCAGNGRHNLEHDINWKTWEWGRDGGVGYVPMKLSVRDQSGSAQYNVSASLGLRDTEQTSFFFKYPFGFSIV